MLDVASSKNGTGIGAIVATGDRGRYPLCITPSGRGEIGASIKMGGYAVASSTTAIEDIIPGKGITVCM